MRRLVLLAFAPTTVEDEPLEDTGSFAALSREKKHPRSDEHSTTEELFIRTKPDQDIEKIAIAGLAQE